MPTNLKSLLSRSRSRTELKNRGDKDPDGCPGGVNENVETLCNSSQIGGNGSTTKLGFLDCDTSLQNLTFVPGMRNGSSCCQLGPASSHSEWSEHFSSETGSSIKTPIQEHHPGIRKCETVVTLSKYAEENLSGFCNGEGNFSREKAKVTKTRLLSNSSATISSLVHSTSRSKLFATWRFPSGSHSQSPEFMASSKVRGSHLSISESGKSTAPMTPMNRLRRNISVNNTYYTPNSTCSRSSSVASFTWKDANDLNLSEVVCRLCLSNVDMGDTVEILACCCRYCKDCMVAYINFEIQEGAEDIACPDADCIKEGVLSLTELQNLVSPAMIEKYKKFRLHREVEKNGQLMWCPTPGCETICRIELWSSEGQQMDEKHQKSQKAAVISKHSVIKCTTCNNTYCTECKRNYHEGVSCEVFRRKLIKQGKLSIDEDDLFGLDCIKKCPFCHVPIEKDNGCAQMMCKKCKHVFCWFCLTSLDDDFLLRHYDKGPCKNKLGHSRASVVWHRAQVIGIFAGFGVLVLLASPLLILAAPCLLCCRCRYCTKDATEDSPVHL